MTELPYANLEWSIEITLPFLIGLIVSPVIPSRSSPGWKKLYP